MIILGFIAWFLPAGTLHAQNQNSPSARTILETLGIKKRALGVSPETYIKETLKPVLVSYSLPEFKNGKKILISDSRHSNHKLVQDLWWETWSYAEQPPEKGFWATFAEVFSFSDPPPVEPIFPIAYSWFSDIKEEETKTIPVELVLPETSQTTRTEVSTAIITNSNPSLFDSFSESSLEVDAITIREEKRVALNKNRQKETTPDDASSCPTCEVTPGQKGEPRIEPDLNALIEIQNEIDTLYRALEDNRNDLHWNLDPSLLGTIASKFEDAKLAALSRQGNPTARQIQKDFLRLARLSYEDQLTKDQRILGANFATDPSAASMFARIRPLFDEMPDEILFPEIRLIVQSSVGSSAEPGALDFARGHTRSNFSEFSHYFYKSLQALSRIDPELRSLTADGIVIQLAIIQSKPEQSLDHWNMLAASAPQAGEMGYVYASGLAAQLLTTLPSHTVKERVTKLKHLLLSINPEYRSYYIQMLVQEISNKSEFQSPEIGDWIKELLTLSETLSDPKEFPYSSIAELIVKRNLKTEQTDWGKIPELDFVFLEKTLRDEKPIPALYAKFFEAEFNHTPCEALLRNQKALESFYFQLRKARKATSPVSWFTSNLEKLAAKSSWCEVRKLKPKEAYPKLKAKLKTLAGDNKETLSFLWYNVTSQLARTEKHADSLTLQLLQDPDATKMIHLPFLTVLAAQKAVDPSLTEKEAAFVTELMAGGFNSILASSPSSKRVQKLATTVFYQLAALTSGTTTLSQLPSERLSNFLSVHNALLKDERFSKHLPALKKKDPAPVGGIQNRLNQIDLKKLTDQELLLQMSRYLSGGPIELWPTGFFGPQDFSYLTRLIDELETITPRTSELQETRDNLIRFRASEMARDQARLAEIKRQADAIQNQTSGDSPSGYPGSGMFGGYGNAAYGNPYALFSLPLEPSVNDFGETETPSEQSISSDVYDSWLLPVGSAAGYPGYPGYSSPYGGGGYGGGGYGGEIGSPLTTQPSAGY